jgi:hypothetical protein
MFNPWNIYYCIHFKKVCEGIFKDWILKMEVNKEIILRMIEFDD